MSQVSAVVPGHHEVLIVNLMGKRIEMVLRLASGWKPWQDSGRRLIF